jgi:hypothetical protein
MGESRSSLLLVLDPEKFLGAEAAKLFVADETQISLVEEGRSPLRLVQTCRGTNLSPSVTTACSRNEFL